MHELSLAEVLEPYHSERLTKAGALVEVWMTSTALVDEAGKLYAIATTERVRQPTTDRDRTTEASDGRDE
jgi:two-component system CheB/CheR fusion protein